jgi:hypothetical protein
MRFPQWLISLVKRGLTWLGKAALGLEVRITDDNKGWESVSAGGGPADRPWYDVQQDLTDVLEAWRKNFLIRQVVRLTTAYVVGDGITLSSSHSWVSGFVAEFVSKNRIAGRLPAWCDEATRSGELFVALFPNPISGMQYVRAIPASQIEAVETDPEDYEKETGYQEIVPGQVERKDWKSVLTAKPTEPVLLHYTINKPVGATRGEGDLTPILPWARRYTEWLKDRVRFNRLRSELAAVDIEIDDDAKVEEKQKHYQAHPPKSGSITVHGKGEKISYPSANIQGFDAEPDGRALRLAFAAGANVPLHFLAEGSSATRSTATEMGDPTHRHYRMRQQDFVSMLIDLTEQAYKRRCALLKLKVPRDLQINAEVPDVSRADNKALADSAKTIVEAFATMKAQGWIDDETAIRLSFKFAGEILPEAKIKELLENAEPTEPTE